MLMRFSKASNLIGCGGDTQPITWGVHVQCTRGGCMHKARVGGARAMHAWWVHAQSTHGGCTCKACVGGCMHKAHVGGACAKRVWGVVTPIN